MFSYNGILPPQPGEVTLVEEAVWAISAAVEGIGNANQLRTLGFVASSDLLANGADLDTIRAIAPDLREQLTLAKVDQRKGERFTAGMMLHASGTFIDQARRQGATA